MTAQYMVLGVAYDWGISKGLDVFKFLSSSLDKKYKIVLVGTNDFIDMDLPDNIISIHKTNDKSELAAIYSSADVFVNPTREDNFPTVNIEALACGTPVITFATGGCPETLDDHCGRVVPVDNYSDLIKEIIEICENKSIKRIECIKKAHEFDMNKKFFEYIYLYRNLIEYE